MPKGLNEKQLDALAATAARDDAAATLIAGDRRAAAMLRAVLEEALGGGAIEATLGDAKADFTLARAAVKALRRSGHFAAEAAMLAHAGTIKPSPRLALLRAMALINANNFPAARRVADGADGDGKDFVGLIDELRAFETVTEELAATAGAPRTAAASARIAYCLHNALPYAHGGYAMRSHALALALQAGGREMRLYARPGFPVDTEGWAGAVDDKADVDGLIYRFDTRFGRRGRAYAYVAEAADHYERVFADDGIGVVHAATPFWTALPAGIAARRLGLPFVYEVRSFWAVTREAREPGFARTPQAQRDTALERIALALADRVVTLNGAMRDHLGEYGVAPDRIEIAPNSVDTERFVPAPRDPALAARHGIGADDVVIGYFGAMLGYEGLDLLVEAAAPLVDADPHLHLLIVGADPGRRAVPGTLEHDLAARITGPRMALVDRVPPDEGPAYYNLLDICAYPRRGDTVCELVSPLKPLEAMASGKAVIVSDVGGMRDLVDDGHTGLSVPCEDIGALREAIAHLAANRDERARLAAAARGFVIAERRWAAAAGAVSRCYDALASGAAVMDETRTAALQEGLGALGVGRSID